MFGDLLLFKIENLEKFEKELSRLFLFYNDGELHFEKNFRTFLTEMIEYCDKYNDNELKQHTQSWLSTFNLAQQNINPYTLERTNVFKSKMRYILYYKILNEINQFFIYKSQNLDEKQKNVQELISKMILLGLQIEAISEQEIKPTFTKKEIILIWNKLKSSEQLKMFQYNLLLLVCEADILFFFEKGLLILNEDFNLNFN